MGMLDPGAFAGLNIGDNLPQGPGVPGTTNYMGGVSNGMGGLEYGPDGQPLITGQYGGQTYNPDSGTNSPTTPGFSSLYNPSMALAPQMTKALSGVSYNQQPLQQIEQNAESKSPSPWANLESQQARAQTALSGSKAADQTAGSTAQAEGNLAMSGGLSSGAGERAQEAGQQAGIASQQGVQAGGNKNLLDIGISDAANKQQQLMALPGMETQSYEAQLQPIQMEGQAQAQDVAHDMANNQAFNQYQMGLYGNQAGMYGAQQTAMGQENAGGGGSWLCTARSREVPYTADERASLEKLREYAVVKEPAIMEFYLKRGYRLVRKMQRQNQNWAEQNRRFIACVLEIAKRDLDLCVQYYVEHCVALLDAYWPDCQEPVYKVYKQRKVA